MKERTILLAASVLFGFLAILALGLAAIDLSKNYSETEEVPCYDNKNNEIQGLICESTYNGLDLFVTSLVLGLSSAFMYALSTIEIDPSELR